MRIRKRALASSHLAAPGHQPSPAPSGEENRTIVMGTGGSSLVGGGGRSHSRASPVAPNNLLADLEDEPEEAGTGTSLGTRVERSGMGQAAANGGRSATALSLQNECSRYIRDRSSLVSVAAVASVDLGDSGRKEAGSNAAADVKSLSMSSFPKFLPLERILGSEQGLSSRVSKSHTSAQRHGEMVHPEEHEKVETVCLASTTPLKTPLESFAPEHTPQFGTPETTRQEAETTVENGCNSNRRKQTAAASVSNLKGPRRARSHLGVASMNRSGRWQSKESLPWDSRPVICEAGSHGVHSTEVLKTLLGQRDSNSLKTGEVGHRRSNGQGEYTTQNGSSNGDMRYHWIHEYSNSADNTSRSEYYKEGSEMGSSEDEREAKRAKKLTEVENISSDDKWAVSHKEQQCNRKDGRGWQCTKPAKQGWTYCEYHLVKIKANHARSAAKLARLRKRRRNNNLMKEEEEEEQSSRGGGGEEATVVVAASKASASAAAAAVSVWRRRHIRRKKKRRRCFRSLHEISETASPPAASQAAALLPCALVGNTTTASAACHVSSSSPHGPLSATFYPSTSADRHRRHHHPMIIKLPRCVLNTDPHEWRSDLF